MKFGSFIRDKIEYVRGNKDFANICAKISTKFSRTNNARGHCNKFI